MNISNKNNLWKYGEPKELSKPHSQGAGGILYAPRDPTSPFCEKCCTMNTDGFRNPDDSE